MTIPTFGPTTRYFNGFRWKCIKDYTPCERVLEAVYNKRNRSFSGHLTVPVTVTSVKDFRPLYVSNHPGLELSCTEEQELIYQNHLSLERKTFRNFFTTYEETCDKYLPIWFPTEHLAGDDRLTRSQIKKIADGIMEQQIPDPVKDYLTIHPETQAVIFAPAVFRLTYDSRRRLLSACGIKRTYLDTLLCPNRTVADILRNLAVLTYPRRTFILGQEGKDANSIHTIYEIDWADYQYMQTGKQTWDIGRKASFDYERSEDGDILDCNSRLFHMETGATTKYQMTTPSGMLITGNTGHLFAIGC